MSEERKITHFGHFSMVADQATGSLCFSPVSMRYTCMFCGHPEPYSDAGKVAMFAHGLECQKNPLVQQLATLRAERDAAVKALQAMLDCMVTEATMDGSTHQAGPSVRRGHPWAQAVAKARKALGDGS